MTKLLAITATAALLLAAAVIAAACGGDGSDGVSLEEYFDRVVEITDRSEEESDAIQEDMDSRLGATETVDEAVDILDEGMTGFLALAARVRDDLDGVTPPDEVADLHRELIAVFDVAAEALEEIQADLGEIDTSASPEAVLEQFTEFGEQVQTEFGSLETESDVICFQMQGLADENSIDIDLECQE